MSDVIVKFVPESSLTPAILVGLATVVFTSPLLLSLANNMLAAIDKHRRYPDFIAVFLSNDQVYFGRMGKLTRNDLRIDNVYYLSAEEYDEQNKIPEKAPKLIKLGKELHGPEDFMLINRGHILFIESLSSDGQVVRAIKEHGGK